MKNENCVILEPNIKCKEIVVLDILKMFLAILVLLRHCGQAFYSENSIYVNLITNAISTIAVPTFFVISGFLLWRKEVDKNRVWRQAKRLFKLYVIWCIIYLPLQIKSIMSMSERVVECVFIYTQRFFFDGGFYHLWFLPALIFSLIFVYYLEKKLPKLSLPLVIGLYIVGVLVDTYIRFIPALQLIFVPYKQLFLTTRNGFFCGSVFVLLGKKLAEKKDIKICKFKNLILWGISAVFLLVIESYIVKDNSVVNMYFSNIMLAPILVVIAIKLSKKGNKIFSFFRNISTILFCVHPAVISLWCILIKNIIILPMISTVIVLIISVILSCAIWVLSKKIFFLNNLM